MSTLTHSSVAGCPGYEGSYAALICVDVQRDFLPGGALAVPGGDEVIAPLSRAMRCVDLIVLSADNHPAEHMSFQRAGGIWPSHCVQGTPGAEIDSRLREAACRRVLQVRKGIDPGAEAYSAFDGIADDGRTLACALRRAGVNELLVGGLATDYCVKATVLDGLKEGFAVTVLADAVRGVDVNPGDSERALDEMRAAGAEIA